MELQHHNKDSDTDNIIDEKHEEDIIDEEHEEDIIDEEHEEDIREDSDTAYLKVKKLKLAHCKWN